MIRSTHPPRRQWSRYCLALAVAALCTETLPAQYSPSNVIVLGGVERLRFDSPQRPTQPPALSEPTGVLTVTVQPPVVPQPPTSPDGQARPRIRQQPDGDQRGRQARPNGPGGMDQDWQPERRPNRDNGPQHQGPQHQGPQHQGPQHQGPQHQGPQHQGPGMGHMPGPGLEEQLRAVERILESPLIKRFLELSETNAQLRAQLEIRERMAQRQQPEHNPGPDKVAERELDERMAQLRQRVENERRERDARAQAEKQELQAHIERLEEKLRQAQNQLEKSKRGKDREERKEREE